MGLNLCIVAVALLLAGYLAFSRRLSGSTTWKATLVPLASIMGSGFLVSAPLLGGLVGNLAVVCMAVLLVLAYGLGSVMRFNIQHFEPMANKRGTPQELAFLSRIVLAGAYFISVTYYLQLLAAFLLSSIHLENPFVANCITTGLLVTIGSVGMWKGLSMLEGLEKYAVALNLGMIGALLFGLVVYNVSLALGGTWHLPEMKAVIHSHELRVILGLLIVVQGFETSRYLGDEHPAEERIKTMCYAQWTSSVIYVVFIALATVLFQADMGADVTAIIHMVRPVASVLPICLTIAAIGSQFSAAVADNEGAGGLIEEITHRKVSVRYAYLLILLVTVALTWGTNVNSIIAYASRAFAFYYLLQCLIAVLILKAQGKERAKLVVFALLAVLCLGVFLFGASSE